MTDKKIVLAIDDNVQQLNEYKYFLVSQYDLRVVKSACEALNFLNSSSADIILLDIEMPDISGFEFLEDIRRIPRYANVPIIIVSGNSGPQFMERAGSSGAVDVLTKPVEPNMLVDVIEKALIHAH
ncbi:MAG: response regulator [Treponema sp.]|jgi:CheY-like chemotaxis protein|nr:response regulator [Treponema sp.]